MFYVLTVGLSQRTNLHQCSILIINLCQLFYSSLFLLSKHQGQSDIKCFILCVMFPQRTESRKKSSSQKCVWKKKEKKILFIRHPQCPLRGCSVEEWAKYFHTSRRVPVKTLLNCTKVRWCSIVQTARTEAQKTANRATKNVTKRIQHHRRTARLKTQDTQNARTSSCAALLLRTNFGSLSPSPSETELTK